MTSKMLGKEAEKITTEKEGLQIKVDTYDMEIMQKNEALMRENDQSLFFINLYWYSMISHSL